MHLSCGLLPSDQCGLTAKGREAMNGKGQHMAARGGSHEPAVRRAEPGEAAALAELKKRTFRETFVDGPIAVPYSAENIAMFEREVYSPEAIAAELADPARAQWVVQDNDGALVAYAHAGPCKLPHEDADARQGELYQLYVADGWQGLGIGRALMDAALAWLAEAMPGPVWVGVFSENYRAQAVYRKRGFEKVGEYEFRVGDHLDREFILKQG